MYAVFKDGKQVSKAHDKEIVAEMELLELGGVVSGRFNPGKGRQNVIAFGYEIRELLGSASPDSQPIDDDTPVDTKAASFVEGI